MKPDSFDNCEHVKSYAAIYSIPEAALLWCGVQPDQINKYLSQSTPTAVRGVFHHPSISCLEPKCRVLHIAIENGELPVCREKGVPIDDHVAPERRHIRREDLKAWIAKTFPADKPSFLFDEVERKAHSSISVESYKALEAERNAVKIENEKLKIDSKEKSEKIGDFEMQIQSMDACIRKMASTETEKPLSERSESSYLLTIGAMLKVFADNKINQDYMVGEILKKYPDIHGLSKRSIDGKFSSANEIFDEKLKDK